MHRRSGRSNNNNAKELRTSVHRKDNNSNNKLSAVVVVGEASESDDDQPDQVKIIDDVTIAEKEITEGVEQTFTSSIGHEQHSMTETNATKMTIDNALIKQQNGSKCTISMSSSILASETQNRPILKDSMTTHCHQNNSLLHSLLKESNEQVKRNLIKVSCSPYLFAEKNYSQIIRHLLSTQKSLQTSCQLLQTINDDINQLDKSFITLSSTIAANNNKLLS
ncbi:uncharacterized protein LOC113791935 [Dermatophagoides pteronyssinus]|uniref:uncharacterized protein LOC113791935 n=1 Tax=Dermatophagoides pteronyssinus TaxID=6956 RepID=UPI003F67685F